MPLRAPVARHRPPGSEWMDRAAHSSPGGPIRRASACCHERGSGIVWAGGRHDVGRRSHHTARGSAPRGRIGRLRGNAHLVRGISRRGPCALPRRRHGDQRQPSPAGRRGLGGGDRSPHPSRRTGSRLGGTNCRRPGVDRLHLAVHPRCDRETQRVRHTGISTVSLSPAGGPSRGRGRTPGRSHRGFPNHTT